MSAVSHQTIKLGKGKHGSPEEGACVMELASMLAGERFTDHPRSVCPAIGSFLRAYNDSIDDRRRQDLYAYAASVVGSHGPVALERARAERLSEWAAALTLLDELLTMQAPEGLLAAHATSASATGSELSTAS